MMLSTLAKLFGLSKPKAEETKCPFAETQNAVEEAAPAQPAKIKATRKPRKKKTAE